MTTVRTLWRWLRHLGRRAVPVVTGGTQPSPQWTKAFYAFQSATAAPASDLILVADGYSGPQKLSLTNSGAGSYAVTPYGSDDGLTWVPVRYQQIGNGTPGTTSGAATNAPVVASGPVTVAANTTLSIQVLDYFTYYKFPMTSVTPPISATALSSLCPI